MFQNIIIQDLIVEDLLNFFKKVIHKASQQVIDGE